MRNDGWLQKLLYLLMIILGIYILYKGGGILFSSPAVRRALDSGTVQQSLEDAAMRTYAPGYAATVERRKNKSWISIFMNQAVPVYSYLAGGEAEQDTQATEEIMQDIQAEVKEAGNGIMQDIQPGENASGDENANNEADDWIDADEPIIVQSEENMVDETEKTAVSEIETEENLSQEISEIENETEAVEEAAAISGTDSMLLEQLKDFDFLLNNYYTVDGGTTADAELLDADTLLNTDLRLEQNSEVPQILIYHTHSQEAFADSREGAVEDTIVGMGEVLAEHLRDYGYQVIHDTGVYDLVDGVLDRSAAYDYARESIQKILEENPTVEVIIDLHRDGVEGKKFVTEIGGKPCSMIMFFNGISRNNLDEPLYWLENPYIQENLAFSLQLQIKAREQYPGFTRNIYLKAERFNLHLRPRSLLIEAGTQLNTVEEERNAMQPLAELVRQVLEGK